MNAIAIAALLAGVAWGWAAYRADPRRTPEQRRADAWRLGIGGAFLAFAIIDWLVMVARPWT